MRGSQIFAGLVIIALIAVGLIYLEHKGYFKNGGVVDMGLLKSDDTAPKAQTPAPSEADQAAADKNAANTAANNSIAANSNPAGEAATPDASAGTTATPVTYPPAANSTSASLTPVSLTATAATSTQTGPVTNPQAGDPATVAAQAAENLPPGAHVVYLDGQGNVCRPVQVKRKARPVAAVTSAVASTQTTVVHRRRRVPVDNAASDVTYRYEPPVYPQRRMSTPCGLLHQTGDGQRVVNLQPGMVINVAMNQDVSTQTAVAGQPFSGYLVGPITYCGEVIVPAGTPIEGSVVNSRRRAAFQQDDAILQLRMSALDANGFHVPLVAYSYHRQMPDDVPYKTIDYMDDPNYLSTQHVSNRDINLPAQGVVSFSLQTPAPVVF